MSIKTPVYHTINQELLVDCIFCHKDICTICHINTFPMSTQLTTIDKMIQILNELKNEILKEKEMWNILNKVTS